MKILAKQAFDVAFSRESPRRGQHYSLRRGVNYNVPKEIADDPYVADHVKAGNAEILGEDDVPGEALPDAAAKIVENVQQNAKGAAARTEGNKKGADR